MVNNLHFLFLILFGIISGIFAGMGMGGGTFLVPLLSVFAGLEQIFCQSTNVICFVCLGVICVIIYAKNELINFGVVLAVSGSSVIVSILCALLSLKIESHILHIIFAGFIICMGIYFFITSLLKLKKSGK